MATNANTKFIITLANGNYIGKSLKECKTKRYIDGISLEDAIKIARKHKARLQASTKWIDIEGYYWGGWDTLCSEETRKNAYLTLKYYKDNEPNIAHRIRTTFELEDIAV